MGITYKIASSIIIIVTISMLLLFYIVIEKAKSIHLYSIEQTMLNDIDYVDQRIRLFEEQIRRTGEIISQKSDIIKALDLEEDRGLNKILNQLVSIYPYFNYIVMVDIDGYIIASNTKDQFGNKIPGEELLGLELDKNPLLKGKLKNKIYISSFGKDPYINLLEKPIQLTQFYLIPVTKRGSVLGYVVINLKWQEYISEILIENEKLFIKKGYPVVHNLIKSGGKIIAGNEEELFKDFLEDSSLISFKKEMFFGEKSCELVSSFDRHLALESFRELTEEIIILMVVVTIILILFLFFITNKLILKKVSSIQRGSNAFEQGELSYQISDLGTDELGILANQMNIMAGTLQERIREIENARDDFEKAVYERTKELENNEQRLRLIMEVVNDGYWDWDLGPDGKGTDNEYLSPNFKKMLGFEDHEMENKVSSWKNLIHPDDFNIAIENFNKHIETDGEHPFYQELEYRKKDGTTCWVICRGLALKDVNTGKYTRMVGTHTDITVLKDLEAELRKSNEELDDFSYITSHDLQEPLRSISTYSKFLLKKHSDQLNEEGKRYVDSLIRLSSRMSVLLKELLHYSKLGRTELAYKNVDLNNVVQEVKDSLYALLKDKNGEVSVSQSLPTIYCDSIRVGEIFRNLITNAVKYNDREKKLIEIGAYSSTEEDKEYVRRIGQQVVYVKDNGIGIKKEHLEDVFTIFRRLHAKEEYGGGTGSGLTLTQKIIQRHGGTIWIESKHGEGSTFKFTLSKDVK